MARKHEFIFGLTGMILLGTLTGSGMSQIAVADIRAAKQKYLREYLGCYDMSAVVDRHRNTPVGQGWGGYSPTEWYIAADLTRAAGCGNNSGETRLRQALDFAERSTIENWWEIEIGVPRALAEGLL